MADTNPYLALMSDDEPKKQTHAGSHAPKPSAQISPIDNGPLPPEILKALDVYNIRSPMSSLPASGDVNLSEPSKNPYTDLLEDETGENQNTSPASIASGAGAAVGAYVGNKRRKESPDQKFSNLPVEMRPQSALSLQRYINSQLSAPVPLNKLKELTGMDIRTMKEAQAAITRIQGAPASREPVVKDVGGRRTTVSYRTNPAQSPVDISMYENPSLMNRIGNYASNTAKSVASGASNLLRPIAGGAIAAPQLLSVANDYQQKNPIDATQVISGLGGLGMMTKSTPLGLAGAAAQIPYAIKHREELARGMSLSDINPTAFPVGTSGAEELPFVEALKDANKKARLEHGYIP